MRISIVIPTFNRANYLEETLSSALAQDYEDLEIVVSDNASSDNTAEVVKLFLKNPKVRYFKNIENIGMVRNWRKAVFERSTGEWFLLLSDDDILTNPKFISQAVRLIRSCPDLSVVYSDSYVYDQALNTVTPLRVPFHEIEKGTFVFSQRGTVHPQDFALCNVLFNRKLAEECEAFANPNNLSCDTELFLRLCLRGQVGLVRDYCSLYRVHSENLLKSVNKDLNLIQGSLDSLIKPLLEAWRRNVDKRYIVDFVQNSRIRMEIFVCLLKMSSNSPEKSLELYNKLREILSEGNYGVLPRKFLFSLIVRSSRTLTPMLAWRRKILYFTNSVKRLVFGRQIYFEPLHRKVYFMD